MHHRRTISVVVYLAALAQTAVVSVFFFGALSVDGSTIFTMQRFAEWLPLQTGLFCLAAFLMPSSVQNGSVREKTPTFWLRIFALFAFFLSPFVLWVVKMEMYGVLMVPTRAHLYMQCMGLFSIISFLFLQVAYARSFSQLRHPRPNPFARLGLALPLYLTVVPCFAVISGAFYLSLCSAEDGISFRMIPNLLWIIIEKSSHERANQALILVLGSVLCQYAAMLPYLIRHGFSEGNAVLQGNAQISRHDNTSDCVACSTKQESAPEPISTEVCGDIEYLAQPTESENSNEEDTTNQRS